MAIAGDKGKVMIGSSQVGDHGEWSLDVSRDSLETTKFGGDGWKSFLGGLRSWTGSISGLKWNKTDAGQVAARAALLGGTDPVTLKLYVNETDFYTGTAIITKSSVKASVSGLIEDSYDLQGTGPLTPPVGA